jgi:hypothetical protein
MGLACVLPTYAQKTAKAPDVGDYPFWSAKKQARAKPFVPGLNAVLQLTAEQAQQIEKARTEIMGSDDVKEAMKAGKTDAGARTTLDAAQKKLHETVTGVLTAAQKDLIEKINAMYVETAQKVADDKQADFAATKGNKEEQQKLRAAIEEKTAADFQTKLAGLLNKAQQEALAKAAEEAKKRAADTTKKKPSK